MNPDTAASMTELMGEAEWLHVPVIDGVAAAIKFAEAIVGMRLRTSKVGDLAYPLPKPYLGKLSAYAPANLLPAKKRGRPACLATRRN